jgi:pilus assembly protein CpaB
MWKVKRMNRARIIVLTIAIGAGGVAACLASGSDSKPPRAEPVAQLQTVDVLVAKADTSLGQTVTPNEMVWQSWPAATASNAFIRRSDRPAAAPQAGTLALASRSIADVNQVEIADDDRSGQRGNINVVRYGVTSSTAVQT